MMLRPLTRRFNLRSEDKLGLVRLAPIDTNDPLAAKMYVVLVFVAASLALAMRMMTAL